MSTILRLVRKQNNVEAICLIKHPLVKGHRIKDWYIKKVSFYVNNDLAAVCNFGTSVSEDPVISVLLGDIQPSDRISVHWTDTQSRIGFAEARLR